MKISYKDIERFLIKFVTDVNEQGCWKWIAGFNRGRDGKPAYGAFGVGGKNIGAHVFSYIINTGPIPLGYQIRHECDNKWCVQPFHLNIGTSQDDAYDRMARGNLIKGDTHPNSKLLEKDISEIRQHLSNNINHKTIARRYGVHRRTINDIALNRTWRHI